MAKVNKDENKEESILDSQGILGAELKDKDNISFHVNSVETVHYLISTGSLIWDIETDGGLPPGVHRFSGPPEAGKSSAALEVLRNFLTHHAANGQSAKGFYVDAEGKLNKHMIARTGLPFVYTAAEWVDGTIFVLQSNIYEFVANIISKLTSNPENKTFFCFILDSIDGLILKDDSEKSITENDKVAGAPKLTKKFLQKNGLNIGKRGHMCILLAQYSTPIQLDPYAPPDAKRPKQGGGGWGAAHWALFAFEMMESYNGDIIRADMKKPPGPANPAFGKRIKVKFKKSTNEKTGVEINYPVKYGVTGKSSVWTGLEVVDYLKMYSMIKVSQWIDFPPVLAKEILDATAVVVPIKFNGEKKLTDWVDSMPEVVEFLSNKFKKNLITQPLAPHIPDVGAVDDETKETEF